LSDCRGPPPAIAQSSADLSQALAQAPLGPSARSHIAETPPCHISERPQRQSIDHGALRPSCARTQAEGASPTFRSRCPHDSKMLAYPISLCILLSAHGRTLPGGAGPFSSSAPPVHRARRRQQRSANPAHRLRRRVGVKIWLDVQRRAMCSAGGHGRSADHGRRRECRRPAQRDADLRVDFEG
jgi:hypothetical protein